MKKLLICLLLVCSCAFGQAGYYSPYDPGAARKNLSNVEAASDLSINSLTLADKVQAAWADILGNVYASGSAIVGAGTAASPAYTTTGDTNTGIYFPAADTIGFAEGGAEAFRVNSAGEVLIATSTDAGNYKLQVAGNQYNSGFTKLGDAATPIKMKVLTGTTAAVEGATCSLAHGVTSSKIVAMNALVFYAAGQAVGQNYTSSAEFEFFTELNATNAVIKLSGTNSGNLLEKSFVIMIWYME